jgi:hypothetical protein
LTNLKFCHRENRAAMRHGKGSYLCVGGGGGGSSKGGERMPIKANTLVFGLFDHWQNGLEGGVCLIDLQFFVRFWSKMSKLFIDHTLQ